MPHETSVDFLPFLGSTLDIDLEVCIVQLLSQPFGQNLSNNASEISSVF